MSQLKLISYNVQTGIKSRHYSDYVLKSWQHILPTSHRQAHMDRIAELVSDYDVVGLQEVDAGSMRSQQINQIHYLSRRAGFPFWYSQINRHLKPIAQHSNGLLTHYQPDYVNNLKLPGSAGRGAMVAVFTLEDGSRLALVVAHLALSRRVQNLQLNYIYAETRFYEHKIWMGDFNVSSKSDYFSSLMTRFGMKGVNADMKTFPSWKPRLDLDHILVSQTLGIAKTTVLNYPLSDHLPLCMTVNLPAPLVSPRLMADGLVVGADVVDHFATKHPLSA